MCYEVLTNLKAYQKKVATAGTAVSLRAAGTDETDPNHVRRITIYPLPSNAGPVTVGDSAVVATSGSETGAVILKPPATGAAVPVVLHQQDLSSIYINAANNGDGVAFLVEW
jgi:hypothetical protein